MDIQSALNKTLKQSRVSDILADMAELPIDSLIANETLKQIPVVKSFLALVETGANIHDKLFLKKILVFLCNIDDVSVTSREKMISKIDQSDKYRISVGEKVLYVIDACADHESASRASRLFRAFLLGKISYEDFISAAGIIARLSNGELELFLNSYEVYSMDDRAKELSHTGLVYFHVEDVEVDLEKHAQDDWDDPEEHYTADVLGGETTVLPTHVGNVVYDVLGLGIKKRTQQIEEEVEKRRVAREQSKTSET